MNFALAPPRADRHPVGLAIVIGLHVLLAAALLSARLEAGPPEPRPFDLTPIETPRPVEPPRVVDLPPPPDRPLVIAVPTPEVVPDPTPDPAIRAQVDDTPAARDPTTGVALIADDGPRAPARVAPRAARLDAGAAQCHPEYPAAAQRAGATGTTRIRFTVDAAGRVAATQILRASGSARENRLMDQAAAAALARCPVQVGTDDQGRPVGTTTDVDYVWTLN